MPIYVYYYLDNPEGEERLEIWQEINEDPLSECPITQRPVKRQVGTTVPALFDKGSVLSDANVASKGFVKYVKTGEGQYERAQGDSVDAPDRLDASVITENVDRLLGE